MVKREQIETKIKSYAKEEKLSAFEASYMWSKGINAQTIAGFLHNKYDSSEGFDTVIGDLSTLEIRSPSDRVEVTNEEAGVVIRDIIRKNQQILIDKIVENLVNLRETERYVLLALTNSSLFEQEKINLNDLKIAYHSIFGELILDRDLRDILRYLEKMGIIYCERGYSTDTIMIPEFVYSIQSQIEVKLPKVFVAEKKKRSE